jgi:predicted ATP-grasp superfamily ATP-dependent carboligase
VLRGSGALVLGDFRQSLAVGRSLRAAGFRVIVGRGAERTIFERSNSVAEVWEHPPYSRPLAWAEALGEFCQARQDVGLVFPVGDSDIDNVLPVADRLPVPVIAAPSAVVQACRNKCALLRQATELGVPTPYWEVILRWSDLGPALKRVGLPAILKPVHNVERLLGFKAKILRSEADAWAVVRHVVFPACGFILQRTASGLRHNFYFIAQQGRLLGHADSRVWRTDCPDGTGLCIEGEAVLPSPTLLRWTETLAMHLGYTGAGCAQYMVDDRSGTVGFLEINTRLGGNSAAACACGLDMPRLFVETVLGVAEPQPPAKIGRRYTWLSGDLNGLAASMRSYGLGTAAIVDWLARTVLAQLRARDHITWSWRDPVPALATFGPIIPAAGRRFLKLLRHCLRPSYMPSPG